jgi:hypothetical protein
MVSNRPVSCHAAEKVERPTSRTTTTCSAKPSFRQATTHAFHHDRSLLLRLGGDRLTHVGSVGTILSNDTLDATGTPGAVKMWGCAAEALATLATVRDAPTALACIRSAFAGSRTADSRAG